MLSPKPSSNRIIIFNLAERLCALRLETVREIVPMAQLVCPPGMPKILQGFLNLAGNAVPVLRLDRLFGLQEQEIGIYTPLLIADLNRSQIALLVENIVGIQSIPEGTTLEVPSKDTLNGCVEGIIQFTNQTIYLLSADRILIEREKQILIDFQAKEQQRLQSLEEARA